MAIFKLKWIFALCFVISVNFLIKPVQAHFDKGFDRNGGHWDQAGYYHCHESQCRLAPSRFQFARTKLSNRVNDLYYLEEDWPRWLILSGCKTSRTVVLESSSSVQVRWTNPRACEIREGLWDDQYNGETFERAAKLEIDHIISPQYANASNGYQWEEKKRAQFTNDPLNLIPVSRGSARKKRGRGIGDWQPREEYLCEYARNWKLITEKYELDLFAKDRSRLNSILEECDSSDLRSLPSDSDSNNPQ
jgi:hypothetical protein